MIDTVTHSGSRDTVPGVHRLLLGVSHRSWGSPDSQPSLLGKLLARERLYLKGMTPEPRTSLSSLCKFIYAMPCIPQHTSVHPHSYTHTHLQTCARVPAHTQACQCTHLPLLASSAHSPVDQKLCPKAQVEPQLP